VAAAWLIRGVARHGEAAAPIAPSAEPVPEAA
jgi:hypothetical protein